MLTTLPQEKKLLEILPKQSGRNNSGKITVRHHGGRHKRFYRFIDFRRAKISIEAKVMAIEYDPNRTTDIVLLNYADGDKNYILAPQGIKVGDKIVSADIVEVKPGNAMLLKNIPIGTPVHAVELVPGKGAQLIRSAGSSAVVLAKENNFVHVKLASSEIRKIPDNCRAVIGQLGNVEWRNQQLGKAGRARNMGKRPEVRGVAQNPRTHPHGGGEGRSGVGMSSPKSPWGRRTLGKKTRTKRKFSQKYIIQKRK